MPAISRRAFFQKSATHVAAAAFLSAAARELHANPLGLPIGSQTYPHRQRIKDGDFAGLCKDIAALGIESWSCARPAIFSCCHRNQLPNLRPECGQNGGDGLSSRGSELVTVGTRRFGVISSKGLSEGRNSIRPSSTLGGERIVAWTD